MDGAVVSGTLIETRKGEKVKIFKKIRRQGYRRTRGHRQTESVLRVTSASPAPARPTKWDGTVDLTPKADPERPRSRPRRRRRVGRRVPAKAEAETAREEGHQGLAEG